MDASIGEVSSRPKRERISTDYKFINSQRCFIDSLCTRPEGHEGKCRRGKMISDEDYGRETYTKTKKRTFYSAPPIELKCNISPLCNLKKNHIDACDFGNEIIPDFGSLILGVHNMNVVKELMTSIKFFFLARRNLSVTQIDWNEISKSVITTHPNLSPYECQRIWKFIAYKKTLPAKSGEENEENLNPGSDDEAILTYEKNFDLWPKVEIKLTAQGAEAKRNYEQAEQARMKTIASISTNPLRACKICNEVVSGAPLEYQKHLVTKHAEMITQCPICKQFITDKAKINNHIATHAAPGAGLVYDCHLCSETFVQKSLLHAHLRKVHSLEKPVKCIVSTCGVFFASLNEMNVHCKDAHIGALDEFRKHLKALEKKAAEQVLSNHHSRTMPRTLGQSPSSAKNSNASPSLSFDAAPFLIQAFDLHMTQIFSRNCEIISTGKLNIEEMKSHAIALTKSDLAKKLKELGVQDGVISAVSMEQVQKFLLARPLPKIDFQKINNNNQMNV